MEVDFQPMGWGEVGVALPVEGAGAGLNEGESEA